MKTDYLLGATATCPKCLGSMHFNGKEFTHSNASSTCKATKKKVSNTIPAYKRRRISRFRKTHKINPVQVKTMRLAGFRIDMVIQDHVRWTRGDLGITIKYNKPISVQKVINHIIEEMVRCSQQHTTIQYTEFLTAN